MTSKQIRLWATAGVLVGVLALDGCGSGDEPATSPTPTRSATATATPEPTAALRGSWTRRMTARDWRLAGSGYPTGTFRIDVDRHGGVSVYFPGKRVVDFTTAFVVKARRMTIASVPVCPGETGRYTWHASARGLRLTVVADDACKPRAALFGGTWRRANEGDAHDVQG
jgi:hypothetical protein